MMLTHFTVLCGRFQLSIFPDACSVKKYALGKYHSGSQRCQWILFNIFGLGATQLFTEQYLPSSLRYLRKQSIARYLLPGASRTRRYPGVLDQLCPTQLASWAKKCVTILTMAAHWMAY